MSTKYGNNSGKTVIEFGTEHIFSYFIIFVIKFRPLYVSVIGILILTFKTFNSNKCINSSVNPLTIE
ncbi:MAG: hypothetical protein Harvfovirus36_16 [Harvfovirus sp.]|uniref:Uncharacterized protein n=1 Tax=Harvfovirus sp. TaxID=2487768 RepID=A0A3G5A2R2_9VIRU|nr:MAG: hypothetical protein Harvfovirus36_16 [Harvfovirus sp.]